MLMVQPGRLSFSSLGTFRTDPAPRGEGIFKGVFLLEALDDNALQRSIDAAVADLAIPAALFETYDLVFAYADRPAG